MPMQMPHPPRQCKSYFSQNGGFLQRVGMPGETPPSRFLYGQSGCSGSHRGRLCAPASVMPSRISASSVASTVTAPSTVLSLGKSANRPRSSLFLHSAYPLRSQYKIWTWSARRLKKTNRCPHIGDFCRTDCTYRLSPSKLLRASTGWVATYSFTDGGSVSMAPL